MRNKTQSNIIKTQMIHFESAINPYGCSPKVVAAMEEFARSKRHRFYGEETGAESLRELLATHFNLASDNFVVFNGAGEALAGIFLLKLVMQRGRLIMPHPSYERFVEAGKRFAAEMIEVNLDQETFVLPIGKTIDEARLRQATLGVISNPNNPTGNLLFDKTGLLELLTELPECLWIIDEAYADYPNISYAKLVNEHPNLIVLRTFSKAYGLAGMRVGYAVAHESVAKQLEKIRLPWSVNSMSLVAVQAALEDQDYLKQIVAKIKTDSDTLFAELAKVAFLQVFPGVANFQLIKINTVERQSHLINFLKQRGILVRSRSDMPQYIRVTSMLPDENQRLLDVLDDFN